LGLERGIRYVIKDMCAASPALRVNVQLIDAENGKPY
jgi:TolB-like protein